MPMPYSSFYIGIVNKALHSMKQLFRQHKDIPMKQHQIDLHIMLHQKSAANIYGNLQRKIFGKTVVPRS